MNRTRLGLLGLCAALFAIMAFGASGAQATRGLVLNGSAEFVDTAILKSTLGTQAENNKFALLTSILGALVHVSCTAATLIGVSLEAEGSLTNGGKAQFTGCSVAIEGEAAPECEVKSAGKPVGTIETNALKGLVVTSESEVLIRTEPKEGTTFVTLQMGAACPIGENVPVQGKLFLKGCNILTVEKVTHLVEQGKFTTLTALGNTATLSGSMNLFLIGAHTGRGWKLDP